MALEGCSEYNPQEGYGIHLVEADRGEARKVQVGDAGAHQQPAPSTAQHQQCTFKFSEIDIDIDDDCICKYMRRSAAWVLLRLVQHASRRSSYNNYCVLPLRKARASQRWAVQEAGSVQSWKPICQATSIFGACPVAHGMLGVDGSSGARLRVKQPQRHLARRSEEQVVTHHVGGSTSGMGPRLVSLRTSRYTAPRTVWQTCPIPDSGVSRSCWRLLR